MALHRLWIAARPRCEHQNGRTQPSQWLYDLEKNTAAQWLTFGMTPSRSVLHEFRDRVQPLLAAFNQQVIRTAIAEKHTDASTAALDGTFVAANASRHRLITLKIVEQRLELLDEEIAKIEAEESVTSLAEEFNVGGWVIEHQLENHGIAWLD